MDREPALLEGEHGAGHIEAPDALARDSSLAPHGVAVRAEVAEPVAQRQRVVLAQRFDVAHLEARALQGDDERAERLELSVGEHVARDERALVPGPRPDLD